ncbi:DJ-1/PfpI family protein [Peribacillus deserti]|uniref:DJ-1/PfpI domain-containing protein n=1 Tax=Peribacillus deserti TaxID=673318 RepID=A0A2N5M191_9BACI|nr:hypothetical protein CUU66_20265 [Peribacillus deserti]
MQGFYQRKKLIGAICGGPALLGASGILKKVTYTASLTEADKDYQFVMDWGNKADHLLVVDKNVVTATGSNYIGFAEEVLRQLSVFPPELKDPLKYFVSRHYSSRLI